MATEPPTSETFEYTSSAEEETPTQPDYYYQSITTAPPTSGRGQTFSSFPTPSPAPQPPTMPVVPTIDISDLTGSAETTEITWIPTDMLPTSAETETTMQEFPKTVPTTMKETSATVVTVPPTTTPSSTKPQRLAPVFNPAQITVTADENESEIEIAK
ncbi:hypothetical protein ANCDUO_26210, partial [Ancylostoma duodenale]